MEDQKWKDFLDWRQIDDPCDGCQGTGKKTYGSTATFWGGIGGQAMTTSVCDECWGSGDKHRAWKSWKLIAQEIKEQAPLYERIRIAVYKVIRSYEQDGDGKPPTYGRPGIKRAWTELETLLNKKSN